MRICASMVSIGESRAMEGAMRLLAVLFALIFCVCCGSAIAQDLNDTIYVQGKKVPVAISPDRIGVIARKGTTPEQMKAFADRNGLDIVAEHPGLLFILTLRSKPADRIALARSPR